MRAILASLEGKLQTELGAYHEIKARKERELEERTRAERKQRSLLNAKVICNEAKVEEVRVISLI